MLQLGTGGALDAPVPSRKVVRGLAAAAGATTETAAAGATAHAATARAAAEAATARAATDTHRFHTADRHHGPEVIAKYPRPQQTPS